MKSFRTYLFVCAFICSATAVLGQWQPVVAGIDYGYFRKESPQNDIFVTRMDRATTSVIIDASLANGKITQPNVGYNAETIPSQVSRYDGGFGFWGRETARYRYNVVAAINGNGFSTANGCPDSGMVMNGAMVKRTFGIGGVEQGGGMGFLYKLGSSAPTPGTPFMAGDMYLPADQTKNRISFSDGTWLQFHKVNDQPLANVITLYTHHYGARTPATTNLTEYVVKTHNAAPLRVVPWSNYTSGTVVEIRENSTGLTPIPFDAIVIAVSGDLQDDVELKIPSVGTEVRFSTEVRDSTNLDWTNMYTAIGPMWGVILRNGVKPVTTSPGYITDVHPRTAVAFNAQYIYFIVVDGRSSRSAGMTLSALADFCVADLAATDAVNNDGGGSSIMWLDGQIKNVPSDGAPRPVCNGLMMIQLEPKETSSAFLAGQSVVTNTPGTTLNMRSGPGTQFGTVQALDHNTRVTVQDHQLKGVRAQDLSGQPSYWWKIRTQDGIEGWVAGSYLSAETSVQDWVIYN